VYAYAQRGDFSELTFAKAGLPEKKAKVSLFELIHLLSSLAT